MGSIFSSYISRVPNSISVLQKYVWKLIQHKGYDNFCDVLGEFADVIGSWSDSKDFIPQSNSKNTDLLKKHFDYVVKLHKAMNEGNLYSAIYHANNLLKSLENNECLGTVPFDSGNYFRVRNSANSLTEPIDLFHVPFEKRSMISPNRFSIAGFPCLYISNNLDCCIEEVGIKTGESMYASVFTSNKQLKVLDLRLLRDVKSDDIKKYLLLLPLLISCSYEAKSEGYYVPEYNIPQLMMHYILKSKYKENIDGIVYNSTKKPQKDIVNFVFPVKTVKSQGWCDKLKDNFQVSLPQMIICANGNRLLSDQDLLTKINF